MNLARYLTEDRIDLTLDEALPEEAAADYEALVVHMADLLKTSTDIVNPTKLRNDLVLRERRAPSLLGGAVAIPHVRTLQARRLVMAVGISRAGLPLPTPDDRPVHLVLTLVAPPYDDKSYLGAYRALGEKLQRADWVQTIVAAAQAGEVLRDLAMP